MSRKRERERQCNAQKAEEGKPFAGCKKGRGQGQKDEDWMRKGNEQQKGNKHKFIRNQLDCTTYIVRVDRTIMESDGKFPTRIFH